VVQVFATRQAQIVFEGDFVTNVTDRFAPGSAAPEFFPYPPDVADTPPPLVVGGDVAALLNDTEGGRELIAWLDQPDSMQPWIDRGGYLSPNLLVQPDRYRTTSAQQIAARFQQAREFRFDLSDQVVGRLGGGPGRGLWRILQEFFRAASMSPSGAARASAVRKTQAELVAASRAVDS
jgi:alpha-glucoside transport system substrate-binding protein